jgi:hypothetical protein
MHSSDGNRENACQHTKGWDRLERYPGDLDAKQQCKGCGVIVDKVTIGPRERAYGYFPVTSPLKKPPQSYNIHHKDLVRCGEQGARKMARPKKKGKRK